MTVCTSSRDGNRASFIICSYLEYMRSLSLSPSLSPLGKEAASPSSLLLLSSWGRRRAEEVLEEVLQEQCDECYRR